MRKYYILLENKRINDEKNKLEQLLNNRTAKQLFTRTINGNKLLFVKETGPEGTHEHKIDYSQRDTILSEIEETRSIRKHIHALSLHLRIIAPNIPKYKSEICKLKIYERYGFVLGYNLIATFEGYTNEKGEKEVFDPYKAESIVRELTY